MIDTRPDRSYAATAGTIYDDILAMTHHASRVATDAATLGPICAAAGATPQFVLPIIIAIDAAIRAGGGLLPE
jgi:hypothetical protein